MDAYVTRVDFSNLNLADDINNLQNALDQLAYVTISQAEFANVETLGANKTLTNDDAVIQMLNPNTANRVVTLPAVGVLNKPFIIGNTNGASYTLDVQNSSAVSLLVLSAGAVQLFISDGTQWKLVGESSDPALTAWAAKTAPSGTVLGTTDTQTATNKRITPRTGTVASSATPTINTDNVDFFSITALAVDITSMTTNLSGTPTEGQTLWIAITGTATRAITWGASFEASTNDPLPTTTSGTTRLDIGFIWNTVTSKWRCMMSV